MFVEFDVDFGVRFIGAVVFAAVSEVIDEDDVAPSVTGIAGMLGEVESLASVLALLAAIALSPTCISIPVGTTVVACPRYCSTFPIMSMTFG